MPCRSLWKKKLVKLEAHWMKKRRRVMIKRRKNGAATHVYLHKSSSLTNTLFDHPPCLPKEDECYIDNCDDPIDSFEISLFDEIHTCYTCDLDTTLNETFENDDAIENYYERGKYGCWNFHVTKTPLFILKVLKLLLFYLPMFVTMCFFDLFSYNIPMHREWVRLKCVSYLLLDALFCLNSYFLCEHLLKLLSLAQRR
jgi:hypothetical protein